MLLFCWGQVLQLTLRTEILTCTLLQVSTGARRDELSEPGNYRTQDCPVCVHMCLHVYEWVCVCSCTCVPASVYMHVSAYICVNVCVCVLTVLPASDSVHFPDAITTAPSQDQKDIPSLIPHISIFVLSFQCPLLHQESLCAKMSLCAPTLLWGSLVRSRPTASSSHL